MDKNKKEINTFLVGIFNEILKREEIFVSKTFGDISVKELHVIEEVCVAEREGTDNRSSAIAEKLRVTAGTLTISVVQLEKKGYIVRQRDLKDKRVVHIVPTESGRNAQKCHEEFHRQMVDAAMGCLSEEEEQVLAKTLNSMAAFFKSHN